MSMFHEFYYRKSHAIDIFSAIGLQPKTRTHARKPARSLTHSTNVVFFMCFVCLFGPH